LESPSEIAKKIAETLNWKLVAVEGTFDIDEDKEGLFVVHLKEKKFLDPADFKAICALTRDLGGDGEYTKASRSWKVPSKFALTQPEKTSKEVPRGEVPLPTAIPIIKLGYYPEFPLANILSPQFTLRMHIETNIKQLTDQISATLADDEQCVILEPLVCRPAKPGYIEVAAGERRLLAAKTLGLCGVPVVVKNLNDEDFDRIRAMENFAREDLTDYETARLLKYLMDKYPKTYPTQESLAEVFGKSQPWISQHLSMLTESEHYHPGDNVETGNLTERQVRAIHGATEEQRDEILDEANQTGKFPSARRIEQIRGPQTVPCARCGEPIEGEPVHFDRKFYDRECYEQVKAENAAGLVPESSAGSVESEKGPNEEPEKPPEKNEALKAIQIGTFDCTDCNKHFAIEHWPNGTHKLREIREAED
jgi:hypothetical protein